MKTKSSYLRLLIVLFALLPISCKEVDRNSPAPSSSEQSEGDSAEQPPPTDQNEAGDQEATQDDYQSPVDGLVGGSPCISVTAEPEDPPVQCVLDLRGEIQENRVEGIVKDPWRDCEVSDLSEIVGDQPWESEFVFWAGDGAMTMSVTLPGENEEITLGWPFHVFPTDEGCKVTVYYGGPALAFAVGNVVYVTEVVSGKVTVTHLKIDPTVAESYEVSGQFDFEFQEGRLSGTFYGTAPYIEQVP